MQTRLQDFSASALIKVWEANYRYRQAKQRKQRECAWQLAEMDACSVSLSQLVFPTDGEMEVMNDPGVERGRSLEAVTNAGKEGPHQDGIGRRLTTAQESTKKGRPCRLGIAGFPEHCLVNALRT